MKTTFSIFLWGLSVLTPLTLQAQTDSLRQGHLMGYVIENGDTLFVESLPPVYVYNRNAKKDGRIWRDFYRTVHNFAKAYPYALQARERMDTADSILAAGSFSAMERERFLAQTEKDLFAEFEAPLKKLT
ncbi:MAG: DUF4294 domain-containing protein, partial [Bacteroidales bacterium]